MPAPSVESDEMPFQLLFVKGPDQGRTVDLQHGRKTVIGRGEDCDIVVHDPRASRAHCRVEATDNRVVLSDAGSTYGTTLNGKAVETAEIRAGDVFCVGETHIRLIQAVNPAEETASPARSVQGLAKQHDKRAIESPTGSGPEPGRNLDNLVGTTLVRYKIAEPLARGKSGTVFRAVDTKHDRPVALKVFWPEFAQDKTGVQRFIRAMKTMMPVKHPNIVRIYGAGLTDGYCWTAMELVEGESLARMMERMGIGGMLDWQSAFRAALHVARALDFAEQQQVVHRNINPGNILISSKDKVAKLGDLMLAKAIEGTMVETVTRAGEIVGDLAFLSPEQTMPEGEIDCRSDIYSLGATIYRLVAGRTPFEASSPAEMILRIQKETPPPPTKFQLSVPPHFEGIIVKMLAKAPEGRYANAAILVRELEKVAKYQDLSVN
jgi:hypothetical protein